MAKTRDALGEKELSTEKGSELSTYFVDPSLFLDHTEWVLDTDGIPLQVNPELYNPIIIAFYGLERWNQYLLTKKTEYRDAFLRQAQWLLTHEVRIRDTGIGWLVPSPLTSISKPGESCLSAYAQGSGLSVLIRAYQLTHGEALLEKIHDVVCTFDRDILDGGILSPIGEEGVFFEEVAIYPATHSLPGCIVALFGLLDYTSVIPDRNALDLINRGLDTVHLLIDEFDAGFWTYKELQSRCLASSSLLTLQSVLLEALARHTDCVCCLHISDRWQGYLARWDSRLRYRIRSQGKICKEALWKCFRFLLFRNTQSKPLMQVCIPVTAFPVTGGIRAVLASVAQAMENRWHIEYVTRHLGPNPAGLAIHQFGTKRTTPWQFPTIWLYVLAGWHKLISLLRQGSGYQLFLPQDGVSTSAFTALAAKFIGTRVVSIDHGNLTLLKNPTYRAERLQAIKAMNWSLPRLLFAQYRYRWYWRSLTILAHFSARYTDHFLIPGIAGDGVEEVCRDLGIRQSQITRFASMVDVDRYPVLDDASKAGVRARYGVPADAIVIALICRLSPEKGLDIALESLSQACSKLSEAQLSRVRVIIAGDGPLREKIESEVSARVLNKIVSLWGETEAEDVIALLSLSDIFFYTSVRGACFSMAVLEAMAASCAVIASIQPLSNKRLLADGRGIAILAGDPDQGTQALVRLIADGDLRHRMGEAARAYVAAYHSETSFRRMLQRATYWFELDSLLSNN